MVPKFTQWQIGVDRIKLEVEVLLTIDSVQVAEATEVS